MEGKEKELKYPAYDRAKMFPASHECSHFVKMFSRNCERPAYKESKDGRYWCETCYILHSGDIDVSTLPLAREMGNVEKN